jgi:hypothetical protein
LICAQRGKAPRLRRGDLRLSAGASAIPKRWFGFIQHVDVARQIKVLQTSAYFSGAAAECGRLLHPGAARLAALPEKGGKELEAPCILKLETYLDEYIAAADIARDKDGPFFRTTGRSTGTPQRVWRRHQNPHRQSLYTRHRHHRLPENRWVAGGSAQDGEPCGLRTAGTLRPAQRCRLAR